MVEWRATSARSETGEKSGTREAVSRLKTAG
jgi:hypothetical protein